MPKSCKKNIVVITTPSLNNSCNECCNTRRCRIGPTGPCCTGPTGIGFTGHTGAGFTGHTGAGFTGPTGAGFTGPTGAGFTGPTGAGNTGPTGAGFTGPTGAGNTGPTGPCCTGPTGPSVNKSCCCVGSSFHNAGICGPNQNQFFTQDNTIDPPPDPNNVDWVELSTAQYEDIWTCGDGEFITIPASETVDEFPMALARVNPGPVLPACIGKVCINTQVSFNTVPPSGQGTNFPTNTIPPGWSEGPAWTPGGTVTYTPGLAQVDGTLLYTNSSFLPSQTLEFRAKFASETFQHIGYASSLALARMNDPTPLVASTWVLFSTANTTNQLFARVNDGVNMIDVPVTICDGQVPLDEFHDFRVDWTPSIATFWIDGIIVATINIPLAINVPQHVIISDFTFNGISLDVNWITTYPYGSSSDALLYIWNYQIFDWTLVADCPIPNRFSVEDVPPFYYLQGAIDICGFGENFFSEDGFINILLTTDDPDVDINIDCFSLCVCPCVTTPVGFTTNMKNSKSLTSDNYISPKCTNVEISPFSMWSGTSFSPSPDRFGYHKGPFPIPGHHLIPVSETDPYQVLTYVEPFPSECQTYNINVTVHLFVCPSEETKIGNVPIEISYQTISPNLRVPSSKFTPTNSVWELRSDKQLRTYCIPYTLTNVNLRDCSNLLLGFKRILVDNSLGFIILGNVTVGFCKACEDSNLGGISTLGDQIDNIFGNPDGINKFNDIYAPGGFVLTDGNNSLILSNIKSVKNFMDNQSGPSHCNTGYFTDSDTSTNLFGNIGSQTAMLKLNVDFNDYKPTQQFSFGDLVFTCSTFDIPGIVQFSSMTVRQILDFLEITIFDCALEEFFPVFNNLANFLNLSFDNYTIKHPECFAFPTENL